MHPTGTGAPDGQRLQTSVSTLSLGTLYEAILNFSKSETYDTFWASVCDNARWVFPFKRMGVLLRAECGTLGLALTYERGRYSHRDSNLCCPSGERLRAVLAESDPQWLTGLTEGDLAGDDCLSEWLREHPFETLFFLPVRTDNAGALVFIMNTVVESERTMLTALGTVYALHAGMTMLLIRANEERRLREKELRESEFRYSVLFQRSNDGIVLLDPEGRIVDANACALDLFGCSAEEMKDRAIGNLVTDENGEALRATLKALGPAGRARLETICRRKDGSDFPADLSVSSFELDGEPLVQGIIRDITDLREMQNQLLMQEKMVSLGSLVAGVVHEINNPIGALNSASDVSARCVERIRESIAGEHVTTSSDGKLTKALDLLADNNGVVVEATRRVGEIIRMLRNFARLDEAEFKQADVHEGMESALTLLAHELRGRVEVARDYGEEVPDIPCYPGQLNQAFMSVLRNAAEAIQGEGTIRIHTSVEGSHVVVQVTDTGRGIPEDHLQRVFDPGFTTKGSGVGIGMGLSLCYSILQVHRGDIVLESQVGQGTTVTLSIPTAAYG
jgi:PAS domain S-box-containing protein